MKTHLIIYTCMVVSSLAITACGELPYEEVNPEIGVVYFLMSSVLGENLAVKYNDKPVDWEPLTGKILAPSGQYTFEFYDTRNGETLGKKTVEVRSQNPERYQVFQPTEDASIAFVNADDQLQEETPPDGYMKIKMANYATKLIPFEQTDVIVMGINMNFEFIPVDTMKNIGRNLSDESYRLVKMGGPEFFAWTFAFLDHNSESQVLDAQGGLYFGQFIVLYPDVLPDYPEKRTYTMYLMPLIQQVEYPLFILSEGQYWEVEPRILFSN